MILPRRTVDREARSRRWRGSADGLYWRATALAGRGYQSRKSLRCASVSESNSAHERREIVFSGRVQGVGFRYTTRAIATRFPVRGFVKNLADGRVLLVTEGSAATLDRLVAAVEAEMDRHIDHKEVTHGAGHWRVHFVRSQVLVHTVKPRKFAMMPLGSFLVLGMVVTWTTPIWLLSVGVALGAAVLAAAYGILFLVSRRAAEAAVAGVREGVLLPIFYLVVVLSGFALLGPLVIPSLPYSPLISAVSRISAVGQRDVRRRRAAGQRLVQNTRAQRAAGRANLLFSR